jgi:hypothetical protein
MRLGPETGSCVVMVLVELTELLALTLIMRADWQELLIKYYIIHLTVRQGTLLLSSLPGFRTTSPIDKRERYVVG